MHIIGTLILSPTSHIVACDSGALNLFRCGPRDLFDKPVTAVIPEIPLQEDVPSANMLYANQFGGLVAWHPYVGRAPNGRSIPMGVLLSRCGYRPSAALCLFLRRPLDLLECSRRCKREARLIPGSAARLQTDELVPVELQRFVAAARS